MKQNVIEFFQNLPKEKHDQFNEAYKLYRDSPNKNVVVERTLNAGGFSERALENLLYDLQKLHGITDVEKVSSVQLSVVSEQEENVFLELKSVFEMPDDELFAWAVKRQEENGDISELLELAISQDAEKATEILTKAWGYLITPIPDHNITANEDLSTGTQAVINANEPIYGVDFGILKTENENLTSENEDLQFEKEELEEENEALKNEVETLKSLPVIDAKSIRVEFPFLNEKDCPDEFKILVADKITAWNTYLENHADLLKIESGELIATDEEKVKIAASAVKAFDENQKIYDELNAYAETGKVLGLHPIFKRLQLTREVEEMTAEELVKYKGSSAVYFTKNRESLAKAEKAKNEERIIEIKSRVEEREQKLALVNKKLGIPAK